MFFKNFSQKTRVFDALTMNKLMVESSYKKNEKMGSFTPFAMLKNMCYYCVGRKSA